MAKNYYQILKLDRTADEQAIANAYRQLALRWHPNKNRENIVAANHVFHQIAEAYEVLSDPARRAVYDRLGEFGLKDPVHTSTGLKTGYRYKRNAEEIFDAFFGQTNPFFDSYEAPQPGSIFGLAARGLNAAAEQPPENIVLAVECSLEELYNGCKKAITYTRRKLNQDNVTYTPVEVTTLFIVKKGYGKGEDVVLLHQGHESAKHPASDLVVRIVELPHPQYSRQGNDLHCQVTIPLVHALLAEPVVLVTAR